MLHTVRLLRAAQRPQVQGGEAGGSARNGRFPHQPKWRNNRSYLPGGDQYGKLLIYIFKIISHAFTTTYLSVLISLLSTFSELCRHRPTRMVPNSIRRRMSPRWSPRGRICNSFTSCSCASWSHQIFNQAWQNVLSTINLYYNYWIYSIRRIHVNVIS